MKAAELGYEPFCPRIQRLDRRYTAWKAGLLLSFAAAAFWIFEGGALYRRYAVGAASVPESARTGDGFLAVSFPRIATSPGRLEMSQDDYEAVLQGLRAQGFVSIGVEDVEDFYEKGRPLPPKAVLVAFGRDNPDSVGLADRGLRRARMRGLLFLDKSTPKQADGRYYRYMMTPHAASQLLKGGAWDLGWYSDDAPRRRAGDLAHPPVLDLGGPGQEWTRNPFQYPMRFVPARSGYNGPTQLMSSLRIYQVRGDLTAAQNVQALLASWPRRHSFVDRFKRDRLGADWVAERGDVAVIGRRMVLVPGAKRTSASAYLSGTDDWRDCIVGFTLAKYRKAAWLYARSDGDRWVRVGIMNGYWTLQEKTGPSHKPATLARAPVTIATSLPARVRLVLKGPWAVVHVNGLMQFGTVARLHPGIDAGRLELDVYDPKPAAALAVVTRFAAAPLAARWIAVERQPAARRARRRLFAGVRTQAVFATALSPRWLRVAASGRVVERRGRDADLLRRLAGYYRCRLVPMVVFASKARPPAGQAAIRRLVDALVVRRRDGEAVGLNLEVPPSWARSKAAARLVFALRSRLRAQDRRLWLTVDDRADASAWRGRADGVLLRTRRLASGSEILEAVR